MTFPHYPAPVRSLKMTPDDRKFCHAMRIDVKDVLDVPFWGEDERIPEAAEPVSAQRGWFMTVAVWMAFLSLCGLAWMLGRESL